MTDGDWRWLEEARRVLRQTCGVQLGQVRLIIAYAITGEGIELTLPPQAEGPAEARYTVVEEPLPDLSPRDREILVALAGDTLLAKQLARRLDCTAGSWFRSRLTSLRRAGLLGNEGRGYHLTDLGRRALVTARP